MELSNPTHHEVNESSTAQNESDDSTGNNAESTTATSDNRSAPLTNSAGGTNLRKSVHDPTDNLNVAFDIVKNRRRRWALKHIFEQGGSTTLDDLAKHIAAIENDKPPSMLSSQERKRVYIGLYQCHLPRMDDAGFIEFNRYRGTIEATPAAEMLQEYVDQERTNHELSEPAERSGKVVFSGAILFMISNFAPGLPTWVSQLILGAIVVIVGSFAIAELRHDPNRLDILTTLRSSIPSPKT